MKKTGPEMFSKLGKVTQQVSNRGRIGTEVFTLLFQKLRILFHVLSRMPSQRAQAFPKNCFREWE